MEIPRRGSSVNILCLHPRQILLFGRGSLRDSWEPSRSPLYSPIPPTTPFSLRVARVSTQEREPLQFLHLERCRRVGVSPRRTEHLFVAHAESDRFQVGQDGMYRTPPLLIIFVTSVQGSLF